VAVETDGLGLTVLDGTVVTDGEGLGVVVVGVGVVVVAVTVDGDGLGARRKTAFLANSSNDRRPGELALTILDDFQGLGVGRLLLSALIEKAEASGLTRLAAVVSLDNRSMLHLLTRRGCAPTGPADESFVIRLEISATGGMPGWPRASAGRRVLVERRGWFEDGRVAALRAAGNDVRQCPGPDQRAGRACPLVESGRCRLAEDADRIVTLLPGNDQGCIAVTEAHRRLWPGKLSEPPGKGNVDWLP
jgi:GNAT superfamily N-acetyltransferase